MTFYCLYPKPHRALWVTIDADTIRLWSRNRLLGGVEIMVRE